MGQPTITNEDALNDAREVLKKAKRHHKSRVMVVISGGNPHCVRATPEQVEKWTQPGMPFVGIYDQTCPVGDIQSDILYAMGGAS